MEHDAVKNHSSASPSHFKQEEILLRDYWMQRSHGADRCPREWARIQSTGTY